MYNRGFSALFVILFTPIIRLAESNRVNGGKLNVLLIIVDDLRPALGCYANDPSSVFLKTPNIDQLASRGFLFENAYAQQALCGPSRTSFLTSRRPHKLGIFTNSHKYWRDTAGNFTTLPQYLKDNGYETISAGKVFHPGKISNRTDDMPYSWSRTPYHPSTQKYKMSKVCPNGKNDSLSMSLVCPVEVSKQPEGTLPDIQTTEFAMEYLNNLSSNHQPFMLAVGLHKPHIPFKYPQMFKELYPMHIVHQAENHRISESMPDIAWNPYQDLRIRDDVKELNISFPYGPLPSHYQRLVRQNYYASVSYVDWLVGKLLKSLAHSHANHNTLILFSSDHGWSLGEHGEWSKYSNFGVALRTPLIVFDPSLSQKPFKHKIIQPSLYTRKLQNKVCSKSKRVRQMVELVDLFPTVAQILKLPKIPVCSSRSNLTQDLCTEGVSLYNLIQTRGNDSSNKGERYISAQYPRPSQIPQLNSDNMHHKDLNFMGYTIRSMKFDYTEWVPFNAQTNTANWSKVKARQLYDLRRDPQQNINVADCQTYRQIQDSMAAILRNRFTVL